MEQIKKSFLHGKGLCAGAGSLSAGSAAAAGVWAVRTVRDELRQNLTDLTNSEQHRPADHSGAGT